MFARATCPVRANKTLGLWSLKLRMKAMKSEVWRCRQQMALISRHPHPALAGSNQRRRSTRKWRRWGRWGWEGGRRRSITLPRAKRLGAMIIPTHPPPWHSIQVAAPITARVNCRVNRPFSFPVAPPPESVRTNHQNRPHMDLIQYFPMRSGTWQTNTQSRRIN